MASGSGAASSAAKGRASGTSTCWVSMSSGSATTTGPGRPEHATRKARATSSGRRAGSSTSTAHFASVPNTAR